MINKFCKHPLWEVNDRLVRVAQGQEPADLVISHARLVSVTTHEILDDAWVAIASGRVAYVGLDGHTAEHCIGPETEVVDANGLYLTPGFIDSHIHVESAMVGATEYARGVTPHGTIGIYWDPHEIANVRGMEGIKAMMADARRTPFKAMVTTPSCVPAVLGFEDTGSALYASDIAESMGWDQVAGLGEMMNYPGILACQENALDEVRETLKAGYAVTGHYSTHETDRGINAFIAAGITSCHESIAVDDVIAKLRLGMWVQLRYGSAWLNLPDYLPGLLESGVDLRHCLLCTDDNHPNTIVSDGHMDRVLREAVRLGCDPVTALQMVSLNAAEYFGVGLDMGSITPGKCADIVFLEDLRDFKVRRTYIDGDLVAEDGRTLIEAEPYAWPEFMTSTMNLGIDPAPEVFEYPVDLPDGTAHVHAIGVTGGQLITRDEVVEVPVLGGRLLADPEHDVLKLCVFDRHHGADGTHAQGFATGFGMRGALAQTVSHDAHNLLVMGSNEADMALAARTLVECGGGEVAVLDGKVLAKVELPVCGLISPKPVEDVAAEVEEVERAWKTMGCTLPSPFMTMAFMSLACVPVLRLTNRGYVNCDRFEMESLLAE